MRTRAPLDLEPDARWRNFGGNLHDRPVRFLAPARQAAATTPEAYADAVLGHAAALGLRVRAYGARWSFSPAAYEADVLVDLRRFDRIGAPLLAREVEAGVDATRLLVTEPGATLAALAAEAEARGRSLPTTNGRGGPTIAGAIATGSHGSAVERPPLGDAVRALGLAVGPGHALWLEAASAPTLRANAVEAMGYTLVRDDALLAAAQVHLGCFGLVTRVVLELDDAFDLLHRWDDVAVDARCLGFVRTLDRGALGLGTDAPLYHANLVMNPHRPARGRLSTATRAPALTPASRPPPTSASPVVPASPLFGLALGQLVERAPALAPAVMDRLLEGATQPATRRGRLGTIFPAKIPRGYRTLSWELAVDRADGPAVLEHVVGEIARRPDGYLYPGFVAVRWVRGTRAPMGFTAFPETMTLELPTLGGVRGTEAFLAHLHGSLERAGVRFLEHPGQHNHLTPARLAVGYGARLEAWRAARAQLLGGSAATFESAWTQDIGLTAAPAVPTRAG
jgi:hypothetical protein